MLYEVRDGVAWITLNRPMILNAADWSLILHLGRALDRAEVDEDVRVVVLGGAGLPPGEIAWLERAAWELLQRHAAAGAAIAALRRR